MESRFKSQALLDERALLSCMAYVDLNPVRAKMESAPETSEHTCIKTRIDALKNRKRLKDSIDRFVGTKPESDGLPFLLKDYIELVDWTSRIIRKGKRESIDPDLPPILDRLSLDKESWFILSTQFEQKFGQWVWSEHIVRKVYSDKHYLRIPNTENHRNLLS